MNDFGTALIFFCAFLVIAYLRSGSMGTVALAVTALIFAGVLALKIAPHALRRFSVWRHVWDDPLNAGYQQVQALMCVASGGLFGLGPGQGFLKHVFAADSDIAFATISEEWGLIVAVMMVLCVAAYGFFAIRTARVARSSFYSIGRLHRCQHSGDSDHSELSRHAGYSALHRRDLPVPEQRRHQHDRRMGAAGLRQGGGHPSECQLCRPPEQEGSVSG